MNKENLVKYGIPLAIGGLGTWGGIIIAKKIGKNSILIGSVGLAIGLAVGYFSSKKIITQ
jgi:hypothetical protein